MLNWLEQRGRPAPCEASRLTSQEGGVFQMLIGIYPKRSLDIHYQSMVCCFSAIDGDPELPRCLKRKYGGLSQIEKLQTIPKVQQNNGNNSACIWHHLYHPQAATTLHFFIFLSLLIWKCSLEYRIPKQGRNLGTGASRSGASSSDLFNPQTLTPPDAWHLRIVHASPL